MKILVTGGAGFIASHVSDSYLRAGHSVVIVDDLSTGRRENVPAGARFFEQDITDFAGMEQIIADERPDVINHHAAQMDVRRSVREPLFDARVNIVGALGLLELGVKYKLRKFLYASTGGASYGEVQTVPVSESHPTNPICHYGVSKLTLEKYLFLYRRLYGLNYTVMRYPNVFGPRQNPHGEAGVVAIFALQMLRGDQPTIFGDGSKTRDYVFIDDIVRANLALLEKGDGETLNLGSGVPTSDYQIFELVRSATHYQGDPQYAPVRPGEVAHIALNPARAREVLGWAPNTSLREGIARTVQSIQQANACLTNS
ncbi:MAG TPA: NAD-dependent epimerase/dehydratase family protein [Candidatus Sulfotelmatobacter sp.]|nr:NAD-dependent epimerase/dehydratase family protein [Candidatus Sulfotelmatobacter sp.]